MPERVKVSWTVDIHRSASEVFDYLADFSRHSEWSPSAFRTEGLGPGPVTAGTTFVSYGAVPGDKQHRNDVKVDEVQRPSRLAFTATEPNGDVFVNVFTITGQDGSCRVERTWDLPKPNGLMGAVFPLLLRAYVRPHVQKGLDKLKSNVESA